MAHGCLCSLHVKGGVSTRVAPGDAAAVTPPCIPSRHSFLPKGGVCRHERGKGHMLVFPKWPRSQGAGHVSTCVQALME